MEKVVQLKKGRTKILYTANKMVYVESIRKLCKEFNATRVPASLTTFFKFKPFYCVLPSEKERQSCDCINCQNPHLFLQAVNRHRKSKHVDGHESLTKCLEKLKAGEKFDEQSEKSSYTYHKYERDMESYTKKDGTPGEYKRVTRIDYHEPVKDICKKLLEIGDAYLKHRTYVDNV